MPQMLLINPAHRPRRRKAAHHHGHTAKRRVRRASSKRRHNPMTSLARFSPVRRRRHNPLRARRAHHHIRHRRRRNPIGGKVLSTHSMMTMFKEAITGGLGAVGMDVLWGQVNPKLPASMQTSATGVGAGDAVKAVATVLLGQLLRKPTKGLSTRLAVGALTTQVRDIASALLPSSMTLAGTTGFGWYTPGRVIPGTARIGPNQAITRGPSPLLNRYIRPGVTPMLSALPQGSAQQRANSSYKTAMSEGVRFV